MKKYLPNLIIAGVTKAGTTSLFTYLGDHPEIFAPSLKEINHFLPIRFGSIVPSISNYQRHFKNVGEQAYRLEASPAYFYGGLPLARAIAASLPVLNVMIVLRDPVSRFISFYNFHKNMLNLPREMTLPEYIEACRRFSLADFKDEKNFIYFGLHSGIYHHFINGWVETFHRRLRILFFEDLVSDANQFVKGICRWLKVDPSFYDRYDFTVENKTRAYDKRWLHALSLDINRRFEPFLRRHLGLKRMLRQFYFLINSGRKPSDHDPAAMSYLHDYYSAHNDALRTMMVDLNVPLPGWLSQNAHDRE